MATFSVEMNDQGVINREELDFLTENKFEVNPKRI